MTGVAELLAQAEAAGLTLEVLPGGRLAVDYPDDAEPLARTILAHKSEVLAALGPFAAPNSAEVPRVVRVVSPGGAASEAAIAAATPGGPEPRAQVPTLAACA